MICSNFISHIMIFLKIVSSFYIFSTYFFLAIIPLVKSSLSCCYYFPLLLCYYYHKLLGAIPFHCCHRSIIAKILQIKYAIFYCWCHSLTVIDILLLVMTSPYCKWHQSVVVAVIPLMFVLMTGVEVPGWPLPPSLFCLGGHFVDQ